MVYKAVLFATAVVILCGFSNGYTDCGSEEGSVFSVEVSNCLPSQKRCLLKRNTNASLEITFSPTTGSDSLKAVVDGVILGVPMPFPLPNPDGCKDSGIQCPIQAGANYTYTAKLPIQGNYPRVTVDIKWQLQNAEAKSIICVLIPAKIV